MLKEIKSIQVKHLSSTQVFYAVRGQLGHLGTKINPQLQPMFTSKMITDHLKATESSKVSIRIYMRFVRHKLYWVNLPLSSSTRRTKNSVIGKHFRHEHGLIPEDLIKNISYKEMVWQT